MKPRLTALRYEADVLGVPYRKLLFDLRAEGALARDPNGRGHTVYRCWEDRFRARTMYRTICTEDGRSFQRMVSIVYCTQRGSMWLRDFVARRADPGCVQAPTKASAEAGR